MSFQANTGQASTVDSLNGLFKEIYADQVENLVPKQNKFLKAVKFQANKKQGNAYHQPVVLTEENGVTYASANSGAYALENASALNMKDATVNPAQMTIRSVLDIESAERAISGGQGAFESATGLVTTTMIESISKRLETQCWYGASAEGIGEGTTANVDTTHTTLTFSTGQFAQGIWVGSTGARLDVYDSGGVQLNTNAHVKVSGVDVGAKTITLESTSTADITAIDAGAQPVTLFYRGAKGQEMTGVDVITQNTGLLFGIDANDYDLWAGNTYDVASATLTFQDIIAAVALAVNRGLESDVTCYINPNVWTQLADDQASLRRYDSSYKESTETMGNRAITFYSQNGMIDIVPSSSVKEGDGFIFDNNKYRRVGSTEVTMNIPGRQGTYYNLLTDNNGYELRAYVGQSVFTYCPAQSVKLTNIGQ